MTFLQFVGDPRGHSGPYTFHNGFRFFKHGKCKVITLGQFFFVRISARDDPCIGELLMLWDDRHNNQRLSSVRLYFLPEQTPEGRLSFHGEHEVLAASDKVVLKVDDLIGWLTDQVDWNHGMVSVCMDDVESPPDDAVPPSLSSSTAEEKEEVPEESDSTKDNKDTESVTREADASDCGDATAIQDDDCPPDEGCTDSSADDKNDLAVMILPYPKYCRYRAMMKRVEGVANKWLRNNLVVALGGFALPGRKTHILFCRDTFDHEELAQHDMNCEYLAPTIKKKRKRRKGRNLRSTSPDTESITSEESKDTPYKGSVKEVKNGLKKQIPCRTEQEFLQKLFKFMKERNTPIQRVPHLGFKQIDLFLFFTFAQKLGGYDKITGKKLWKHVYDELGGDPGSTSAATCTRKHYERLLLPFERYMEGKECELTADPSKPRTKKIIKDENESCDAKEASNEAAAEGEDTYNFTDSNHENSNSKDSNTIGDANSGGEENFSKSEGFSDVDNKTVWSVQQKPDAKDETDRDNCKQVKPLIIQKGQNETFSEKERKWNEIRRKNALARKRVRQLRPSRGFKMPSAKILTENLPLNQGQELPSMKTEPDFKEGEVIESDLKRAAEISPENSTLNRTAVTMSTNRRKIRGSLDHSQVTPVPIKPDMSRFLQDKMNSSAPQLLDNGLVAGVNGIPFVTSPQTPLLADKNVKLQSPYVKPDPSKVDVKSLYGYSKDSLPYQKLPPTNTSQVGINFFTMSNNTKEESKPLPHLIGDSTCDTIKGQEQNLLQSGVFPPTVKMEVSNNDEAANVSQRRPSVIQHTEFITSPSASQSPEQPGIEASVEAAIKDGPHILPSFNGQKIEVISNHLSQTMAGKVAEWLTKGAPDIRACRSPPKATEFHSKVMVPSRTPTNEANKVHAYLSTKSRNQNYVTSTTRIIHDKYSPPYMYRKGDSSMYRPPPPCTPVNNIRNNALSQQTFPPVPSSSFTGSFSDKSSKYLQSFGAPIRNPVNVTGTYFNHPKRHKAGPVSLPSPVSARPSLHPSSHQHMYRTSPLSDVPKVVASSSSYSGCESSVLDLSVKRRPPNTHGTTATPTPSVKVHLSDDGGVCLDLSMKKKPSSIFTSNNGIENITPPLPASPSPAMSRASSYTVTPPLKALPTLLSLHDLVMEEAALKNNSSSRKTNPLAQHHTSSPLPPHLTPTSSMTLPPSTHGAVHPSFTSPLPHALYPKDVSKNMYLPKEHHPSSQFLPYVIPSLYPQNWTSSIPSNVNTSSYSKTTSPSISKGTVSHGIFPKHPHPYNYNPQLYPAMCKDNVQHPSNTK